MKRATILVVLAALLATPATIWSALGRVEVTVVDVGSASCIIAKIPAGQTHRWAIIDAGVPWNIRGQAREVAELMMKQMIGNDCVELLVVSHSDYDHHGLVPWVLETFNVHKVVYPKIDRPDTTSWQQSRAAIESETYWRAIPIGMKKISEVGTLHGVRTPIGDATYTFLSGFDTPPTDWGISTSSANATFYRNAPSIVVRLAYFGQSILFMGDALGGRGHATHPQMTWAEKYIIDSHPTSFVRSDVLIAGHHGADNASYPQFIATVQPEWVVFTAGRGHHHPSQATADRFLQILGLDRIFRTDLGDDEGGAEWPHGRIAGHEDRPGLNHVTVSLERGVGTSVEYLTHGGGASLEKLPDFVCESSCPTPAWRSVTLGMTLLRR